MSNSFLTNVKGQLGINYQNDENVLNAIYTRMMLIASHESNRAENDTKLIPYVENATISAYLRRGKEGTSGYSEGSESETYIDIEDKLKKELRSIRRIF